jgi:hypothetical protein
MLRGVEAQMTGHAFVETMVVATVFTSASILRGYAVRRHFNALQDELP